MRHAYAIKQSKQKSRTHECGFFCAWRASASQSGGTSILRGGLVGLFELLVQLGQCQMHICTRLALERLLEIAPRLAPDLRRHALTPERRQQARIVRVRL